VSKTKAGKRGKSDKVILDEDDELNLDDELVPVQWF
jgi:hypothetical protein